MLTAIAIATASVVGLWAVLLVVDRPQLMVPIAMCAVLLDTEEALNDPIALRAGPLSIYPSDVLLVLILGVIALQLADPSRQPAIARIDGVEVHLPRGELPGTTIAPTSRRASAAVVLSRSVRSLRLCRSALLPNRRT